MSIEPIDLDAAQALADAASPGPWLARRGTIEGILHVSIPDAMHPTAWPADAEFIAQARTLVPALIARVRELEEENTRIQARQVAAVADRIDSRSNAMVVDLTEKLVAAEGTITRLQSELRYLDRRYIDRGDQLVMLRVELKAARAALKGGA